MLFQPAIIALILSAGLDMVALAGCVPFALTVLVRWDLSSGSQAQVRLERRTYVVSVLVRMVLVAQLAALVLFVFNADRMAALFTGAMCAVGTLRVNDFGFPTLFLHMAVFFLAFAWLVLDHADRLGWDYPLIRVKYGALLVLAPLLAATAAVQLAYFLDLRADVITSCCSTLFGGGGVVVVSNSVDSLPHAWALGGLAGGTILSSLTAFLAVRRWRLAWLHALVSPLMLAVGLVAIIATLSVYVYELPAHHCPFCILKGEYGHVGYLLYAPLFLGCACGVGAGIAAWAGRAADSLRDAAPPMTRVLAAWSGAGFALFGAVAAVLVWRSHLILFAAGA